MKTRHRGALAHVLVTASLTLGGSLVARALLVTMSPHSLSADELRIDHTPPGRVGTTSVVTRGRASPPGVLIEDISTGAIQLNLVPPSDDRTPVQSMGYRVRAVGGTIPVGLNLPLQDVRAIVNAKNAPPYLVLYWNDPPRTPASVVELTLSVAAVDLAGNVGVETRVEVKDPAPAPGTSGCAAGQRKCPDGSCKPSAQACGKPCKTCPGGRCCETDENGCCTMCIGKKQLCP